jgi:hypothetical protein
LRRARHAMGRQARRGRQTIGSFPDMSLHDARKHLLLRKSAKPSAIEETIFLQTYDAFKAIHFSQKKARTQKDDLRMLDVHFTQAFKDKKLFWNRMTASDQLLGPLLPPSPSVIRAEAR